MATEYSVDELLAFLDHAADRGLMPTATARALGVASRRVFEILPNEQRADVRRLDVAEVFKRFQNKHAKDFTPSSLKEYGRRAQRAVEIFRRWRDDPATFSVKTRSTTASRKKATRSGANVTELAAPLGTQARVPAPDSTAGYETSFPVRPGLVVTLLNIPADLSKAEAERLAQFVKMLAVE
jgi:hypothetical protein